MRIRNIIFSIIILVILGYFLSSFLQSASAGTVGMTIRKNGALINEENLYWAYAYDTSSDASSASSSLMKLQVLTDSGLEDRFRIDKAGNVEVHGNVDANSLCIKGICQPSWSAGSGVWTLKGDDEIYYDTDFVGIGTDDPSNNLHIYQDSGNNASIYIQSTSGPNSHWSIYHDGVGASPSDDLRFWNSGSSDLLTLSDSGMVGISDTNPDVKLAVNGGVQIGFTNTCEDGVLRFNSGEFEYCYSGAWIKVSSGEIVGDVTDVTWPSWEYSSGNVECGDTNTGCTESYDLSSTSQTCGKKSWGGSAKCDDSKLSVYWDWSTRSGHQSCSYENTGCVYSFDSNGDYKNCGGSSDGGSAICDKSKLSVYWSSRSNANIECSYRAKGCEKAQNYLNTTISCGNNNYDGGSALCSNDTLSIYWESGTKTGNSACSAQGRACIEAFDWRGDFQSCGTSLTGYGWGAAASCICY